MYNNIYNRNGHHDDYDSKLLDMLKEAMLDEKKDNRKYRIMMDMTDNREVIDQIRYAYEDEAKHYKMFQEIYEDLTGKEIQVPSPEQDKYSRLIDAVKSSINGELEAVELYRDIRSMLRGKRHRDMVYEIITDEQEHATRFVYLYSMLR